MLEPLVWKFEIFDVGDLRGYQAGCVLRFSDFGCVWPGGFMNGMHQQQVNKLTSYGQEKPFHVRVLISCQNH